MFIVLATMAAVLNYTAGVVFYECNIFIVQATGHQSLISLYF